MQRCPADDAEPLEREITLVNPLIFSLALVGYSRFNGFFRVAKMTGRAVMFPVGGYVG